MDDFSALYWLVAVLVILVVVGRFRSSLGGVLPKVGQSLFAVVKWVAGRIGPLLLSLGAIAKWTGSRLGLLVRSGWVIGTWPIRWFIDQRNNRKAGVLLFGVCPALWVGWLIGFLAVPSAPPERRVTIAERMTYSVPIERARLALGRMLEGRKEAERLAAERQKESDAFEQKRKDELARFTAWESRWFFRQRWFWFVALVMPVGLTIFAPIYVVASLREEFAEASKKIADLWRRPAATAAQTPVATPSAGGSLPVFVRGGADWMSRLLDTVQIALTFFFHR